MDRWMDAVTQHQFPLMTDVLLTNERLCFCPTQLIFNQTAWVVTGDIILHQSCSLLLVSSTDIKVQIPGKASFQAPSTLVQGLPVRLSSTMNFNDKKMVSVWKLFPFVTPSCLCSVADNQEIWPCFVLAWKMLPFYVAHGRLLFWNLEV